MSYCTVEELENLTGSDLPVSILQEIVDQVDRQINARIRRACVDPPASDESLKAASLNLAIASVVNHPDSTEQSSSVKLGDITIQRADLDTKISNLMTQAYAIVDSYILNHGTDEPYRYYMRKVN